MSNLTTCSRSGYGIKSVHEIHVPSTDDQVVKWKKVSSDAKSDEAKILTTCVSCEIVKDKGDKVETECEEPERIVDGDQSSDGILFIALFYYDLL